MTANYNKEITRRLRKETKKKTGSPGVICHQATMAKEQEYLHKKNRTPYM